MLKQPLSSSGDFDQSDLDVHVDLKHGEGNPFPGLRPFSIDECHLFFGRESQVDDILLKLSRNRFLAVMGYSGSGKSSLMYCGLIPVLYGGFVTQSGPNWHVISCRPGSKPIDSLASSIIDYLIERKSIEEEQRKIHLKVIGSILRSGQHGLVEVSRIIQKKTNDNVFFLIDQFEEIFRVGENEEAGVNELNEAQHFVNLILAGVGQEQIPVYASITMRSDFIGKCSVFPRLTNLINKSNYLVPQMTRDQKKMVIEGPIAVAGGKITQRLVKRLLSDVGNDQDQLPLMQHSLMRTWDHWMENREPGEPIDLRHYYAIGGISQALSLHANEAYDELSTKEKEIAEVLFKSVTEKNQENKGMRRACRLNLITELSGANELEVIEVINQFRRKGRSFLMPPSNIPLTSDSLIELSHESLMRIWNRLDTWVEEEFESAQMYKRLSEAASMYQIGKTGLWRPPDLQLALNWQKKQKPTRAWAQRYDETFERAIVFLDTSRITYEAELKNQEMMQKRVLRRTRATAVVLGIAAVIAMLFMVFAYIQRIEALNQSAFAIEQRTLAVVNAEKAEKQATIAITERNTANSLRIHAESQRELLEKNNKELEQLLIAVRRAEKAAREALAEAEKQKNIAIVAREDETVAKQQAIEQYDIANRLYMLTIAQAMSAKSRQENDDKDLAGLLAIQAYHFHRRFEGNKYDPYVYSGLYYANTKLSSKGYNAIKIAGAPRNRINSIVEAKDGNNFYAAGADGRIFKGDYLKLTSEPTKFSNPNPNRVIALSKDSKYLVNGTDSANVQIFNLKDGGKPLVIKGFKGVTNDIDFLPNNDFLVTSGNYRGGDYSISSVNLATKELKTIVTLPVEIKKTCVSPDGSQLVAGTWSGEVFIIDVNSGKHELLAKEVNSRILSVTFSPDGNSIAYGIDDIEHRRGLVKIQNLRTKEVRLFGGHNAGVFDVEFSPDGKLLASAGSDKKLQLWVLDHPEDLPIEMDNNNGFIFDIIFTQNSKYLLATTSESEIRVWPTDMSLLAEQICPQLTRNLTPDEWSKYIGADIPFENTCLRLLIKDYGK